MSPPALTALTTRITNAIELSDVADRFATALQPRVAAIRLTSPIRDTVSGTWLGHPLHPFLVTVPIGCWTCVSVLDLSGQRAAAQTLAGAGVLAVLPTAAAGLSDWTYTSGAERTVGFVHLVLNAVATGCYALSWLSRRRHRHGTGVALAVAGALAASGAGWLGGHLAYALGVGVDTNAFDAPPVEWTTIDVDDPAPGRLSRAAVGTTPLVLTRQGDTLRGLADRCSHRGGPLSGGTTAEGCVICPWHGSRFDLKSGEVRQGPAVVAQPTYEVRRAESAIQVRRVERRALRANVTRAE
jgi:nitrite reductase/ring-hydroxylating ferredoxin subunit/uncharacterized membrane protein